MTEFVKRLWNDPKSAAKFIVAICGAAAVAVSQGLLPDSVGRWVTVAVAFLTAIGVYGIPNSDSKDQT